MLISMTGIGIGEAGNETIKVIADLRSVNNRYFEMSCKLPGSLNRYEQKVRELIREKINRGKVYLNLTIQNGEEFTPKLCVARERVQDIRHLLDDLKEYTGVAQEPNLDHFLHFSEMFDTTDNGHDSETLWIIARDAVVHAVEQLLSMRTDEGAIIETDMRDRIHHIFQLVNQVEEMSVANLEKSHQLMQERVQKLLCDIKLSEERIYTEIALITDKIDVTEECVRMGSHYTLFMKMLDEKAPVGKKLNFLLQEMNREVNTISSKAQNADISHLVVDLKEEIEKIREQVQNLE